MKCSSNQPPPVVLPSESWAHFALYSRVKNAIASLPLHFRTETTIEGMSATDIFALNSALGASIEDQVVTTLNSMRTIWDPEAKYSLYGFIRQPQTFPDVVLRRVGGTQEQASENILLGVELKGWYLLSKEKEPSFRFTVTPDACAVADLLVCVPWALKNVLSGSPKVFRPYIISAKEAALRRNYYWEHLREAKTDSSVLPPTAAVKPYPRKSDLIADHAAADSSHNFGRYARTGLMDEYLQSILSEPLCGISASSWLDFFKIFTENYGDADVKTRILKIRAKLGATGSAIEPLKSPYLEMLDIMERAMQAI